MLAGAPRHNMWKIMYKISKGFVRKLLKYNASKMSEKWRGKGSTQNTITTQT